MIYLDNGATSFRKPPQVRQAVLDAMSRCANPGRGGYGAVMEAARVVYHTRELAAELFECDPEQVVFTSNCTHGLNIAIRTLVRPGGRVVISGFEHNAVTRPLYGLNAKIAVAGRKLFDWENTLEEFEKELKNGVDAAIFTHVSNVFGYILPVDQMAVLCRRYGVPFVLDAAQSAGKLPLPMKELGADFVAMPGHKGLLGPQGTGVLLCGRTAEPLLRGGTGSESIRQDMPDGLPERLEAGTVNVPGIAGLGAGLAYLKRTGVEQIGKREEKLAQRCVEGLGKLGVRIFAGPHQAGAISFVPPGDCEEFADALGERGIAVRAGLHCAPLAHQSAGTIDTGTVRVSFGHDSSFADISRFVKASANILSLEK